MGVQRASITNFEGANTIGIFITLFLKFAFVIMISLSLETVICFQSYSNALMNIILAKDQKSIL